MNYKTHLLSHQPHRLSQNVNGFTTLLKNANDSGTFDTSLEFKSIQATKQAVVQKSAPLSVVEESFVKTFCAIPDSSTPIRIAEHSCANLSEYESNPSVPSVQRQQDNSVILSISSEVERSKKRALETDDEPYLLNSENLRRMFFAADEDVVEVAMDDLEFSFICEPSTSDVENEVDAIMSADESMDDENLLNVSSDSAHFVQTGVLDRVVTNCARIKTIGKLSATETVSIDLPCM